MDIATLGLKIDSTDAVKAKQDLDALAVSGSKAEQQLTASATKMSAAVRQSAVAIKEAQAAYNRGEASLMDEQLLRRAGLLKQETTDWYAVAAAERAATEAQVAQIAAQGSGLYATQAMIKAQAEAIAMDARMSQGLSLHGLQLGRLNQEIGTFIGRLTGTNTAVTRLTAQIGGAVVGYGSMIAVLGGVTLAIAGAEAIYNKFTEATRKAREENERLLKVLDDIAKRRGETQVTTTQGAIAAGQAKLADLQAQLANAESFAQSTAPRGYAGGGLSVSYGPSADEALKNVNDLKAKVASAEAELTELVRKGAEDRDRAITADIANLVKSGQATEKQVTFAKQLLAGYEDSLTKLQKAGSSDTAALVDLADKIKQLNDALNPKQRGGGTNALTADGRAAAAATAEYEKEANAVAKVRLETAASLQAIRDRIALLDAEGIEHDRLANHLDFEAQRRKLTNDIIAAGSVAEAQALIVRRDALTQLEQLSDRYVILSTAAKYAKEAQEGLNQAVKNLKPAVLPTETLDKSTGLTHVYFPVTPIVKAPETKAADDAMQQFERSLTRDLSRSISDALQNGLRSFRDFVNEARQLVDKLAGDIAAKKIGDLLKGSGAAAGAEKFLGPAAIATVGLTAAYQVGQSNSTKSGAELSGGIGGLLVGGPGGATAGLVASLLGFNKAAKAAQKQIEDFHKAFDTVFTAFRDEGLGMATDLTRALAANAQQAEAFRQQTEEALAGKRKQTEREKELDAITAAETANAKKIATDFWKGIDQQLNALNGPAGAYANQVQAIKDQYNQNIISADAAAKATGLAGASDADRAKILELETKALAAAAAAEAERLKQVQYSLDAREAEAKGLTAQGEAIARKAQEEKELFDAEQQGYTKEQIAQLKYIQGLEDEAAAKQKIIDATAAYNDAVNAGPTGSLATKAATENAALQQKLADDTAQYNAAVTQLATDMANGADAATIAADQNAVLAQSITVAGDNAAIAAAQFQQAAEQMAQASNQIEKDVSLGFITGAQGIDELKKLFGFTGLSDAQIKALYTPYSGTPLTNEQTQQNQNVETYLRDIGQWGQQVTDAVTKMTSGGGEQAAIANAAKSLTEVTGNRMADYLAAILTVDKQQLEIERRAFAGGTVAPFTPASSPLSSASLPVLSQIAAGIDRLNAKTTTTTGTGNVSLNVTFKIENLSDPVERRRIIADLTDDIDRKLQELASDSKIRAGSTLRTV